MRLSPLDTCGSFILDLSVVPRVGAAVACDGGAGPGLAGGGLAGPPCVFTVFLVFCAGGALSSESTGDGGSEVLGLGALDGSWLSSSPNSHSLMSFSVRSISSSLSIAKVLRWLRKKPILLALFFLQLWFSYIMHSLLLGTRSILQH